MLSNVSLYMVEILSAIADFLVSPPIFYFTVAILLTIIIKAVKLIVK